MIYEVHRKVKNNIGDLYCNPSRYFNFKNCSSGELLNNEFPIKNETVVIGGGGLIHKKFQTHIKTLINKNPKNVVLWGIGHNFVRKHVTKTRHNVYYPEWINRCSLVGIRDWIDGYYDYYLPCVSCMHSAFDKQYDTMYDTVFFTHKFKSNYVINDQDVHMENNETDFEKVIKFLASGETVITDSYHGAYWAQLLGKNVKVVSWSVKFDHMKYPPIFLENINDKNKNKSVAPENFLDECRSLNISFHNKFLDLLNK